LLIGIKGSGKEGYLKSFFRLRTP